MIHDEFVMIGQNSLSKINTKLLEVNVRFSLLKGLTKTTSMQET